MQGLNPARWRTAKVSITGLSAAIALVAGSYASVAQMAAPTVHKGLDVTALGVISENSMTAQIGLSGYRLQLRAITIMPGGQIAKHSHETRPGLVKVIGGTWIEGRPGGDGLNHAKDARTWFAGRAHGETVYDATDAKGLVEDRGTVHWIWNRGPKPATAIVCDIVPSS